MTRPKGVRTKEKKKNYCFFLKITNVYHLKVFIFLSIVLSWHRQFEIIAVSFFQVYCNRWLFHTNAFGWLCHNWSNPHTSHICMHTTKAATWLLIHSVVLGCYVFFISSFICMLSKFLNIKLCHRLFPILSYEPMLLLQIYHCEAKV